MKDYDKNWAYSVYSFSDKKQRELEEAEARTNLFLQMANNIMDMSARITQLENRLILNAQVTKQLEDRVHELELYQVGPLPEMDCIRERLDQLEANKGKFYAIHDHQVPKMLENVVKRLDEVESWLYTHDYAYFQEQEKQQGIADNAQLEETGTHAPDCRCAWCEPQETLENMNEKM